MPIEQNRLHECLAVLEEARSLPADHPHVLQLEQASAHLRKSAKKKRKAARVQRARAHDKAIVQSTVLAGGDASEHTHHEDLNNRRSCYVCKQNYHQVHYHYHTMCRSCGELCFGKRDQRGDLSGRRALITGGRTKIGYATSLKLLRDGAEVHLTTRFPKDAARRFAEEEDHQEWQERVHIVGADFRRMPEFLSLVQRWKAGPAFDILINNAAQTVYHPPEYYRGLWAQEQLPFHGPNWIREQATALASISTASQREQALALFPAGKNDVFGNPIDLRRDNSWVQHLGDINSIEMVEVQVVNNIAPFVLCNELLVNMERSPFEHRFIINVTAVEGQFERAKSTRHPHTNMAKAALNMLTRTSAADCERRGIHMVAVDPGWMSHEGPHVDEPMQTPLEAMDSAARIYDPILSGIAGEPRSGVLLKDFREVPW